MDLNLRDVRSFVLDNPCTPVPDDTIELIGHVRVIMQVVETPTGTQSSLVHFNQSFRGEDAAGVDYTVILTEQNMAHLSLDGPRGSVAFTLNIISHGGTGNLVVKTIGNSNGIVVDTAECRG
ncbi:MAG: hypothetical protein HY331_02985 [Chloroflexi bacterium]|nr:hypothetical protein [Chloroflexota bacterium]